jgi:hypothetical protein
LFYCTWVFRGQGPGVVRETYKRLHNRIHKRTPKGFTKDSQKDSQMLVLHRFYWVVRETYCFYIGFSRLSAKYVVFTLVL